MKIVHVRFIWIKQMKENEDEEVWGKKKKLYVCTTEGKPTVALLLRFVVVDVV